MADGRSFSARTCPALSTLSIARAAACSRPLWRLQCAGGNPSMFLALKSPRKSSGLALTLMWLHSLRVTRIVVLLHGDLHPLGLVDTLHSLARAVVWVGPAPEGMRSKEDAHQLASMLQRKGSGKVVKKEEYFSILTGFTLKAFGEPTRNTPPDEDADSHSAVDTAAYLTFNLQLSDTERQARDRVPLPFHFSAQKKSSLLEASAGTGKIYYEPDATDDLDEEDPDDDLDV